MESTGSTFDTAKHNFRWNSGTSCDQQFSLEPILILEAKGVAHLRIEVPAK